MPDAYASHLPVLRMVLALAKPKRVLELGMGSYSTPAFLASPLERLVSIETVPEWAVAADYDERHTIRVVEDTAEALPDLHDFDLVFIDNDDNPTDRERAIRAVLSQEHPATVIHDAENPAYQAAIDLAPNRVTFTAEVPWTAVVW